MSVENELQAAAERLKAKVSRTELPPVPARHPLRVAMIAFSAVLGAAAVLWVVASAQDRPDMATPTTALQPSSTTLATGGPYLVPDLRGLTLEEAESAADEAGLRAVAESIDPQASESVVIAQEPPNGTRVPDGAVVGVRTITVSDVDCSLEDPGPQFIDVPATYGGVTLVGLRDGSVVRFASFPSVESGWYPVVELPLSLSAGTEPVWIVLRQDPPAAQAGLLFDPSVSNDSGRYRLADTSTAVRLSRCHEDGPTQFLGGLIADRPGCVRLWLYEGTLASDPTIVRIGVDEPCGEGPSS